MKYFTLKSDEELYFNLKSNEKNKPKKTLKRFIPLSLLLVAAAMWIPIVSNFYKIGETTNIRIKKDYYFQMEEFVGIFSRRFFEAAKFKKSKDAWVSFYQENLLKKNYYCIDDRGKDSNFPDGLADKVEIGRKEFIRENDYETNKPLFHKADQYIALVKSTLENKFSEEIN